MTLAEDTPAAIAADCAPAAARATEAEFAAPRPDRRRWSRRSSSTCASSARPSRSRWRVDPAELPRLRRRRPRRTLRRGASPGLPAWRRAGPEGGARRPALRPAPPAGRAAGGAANARPARASAEHRGRAPAAPRCGRGSLDAAALGTGRRWSQGPALIEGYSSTTWVPPGWRGARDAAGNMLLRRRAERCNLDPVEYAILSQSADRRGARDGRRSSSAPPTRPSCARRGTARPRCSTPRATPWRRRS